MNFADLSSKIKDNKITVIRIVTVVLLLFAALFGIVFREKIARAFPFKTVNKMAEKQNDVDVPSIINGDLVLPKVSGGVGNNNLGGGVGKVRLAVLSANLLAIFDQQTQALSGIRIIGEVTNLGTRFVTEVSPVVRFLDTDGKLIAQKIGTLNTGYTFFDLAPGETNYYDVLVQQPPTNSDRLEIVLNPVTATSSATFELLKISDRKMEAKTVEQQAQPQPVENNLSASESGATKSAEVVEVVKSPSSSVEYYSITGKIVNPFNDLVTDITVYAWARDKEGKVFSYAKQDFKNDLISPGENVEFRLTLVPFLRDKEMTSYEIRAFGKKYKLGQ